MLHASEVNVHLSQEALHSDSTAEIPITELNQTEIRQPSTYVGPDVHRALVKLSQSWIHHGPFNSCLLPTVSSRRQEAEDCACRHVVPLEPQQGPLRQDSFCSV